MQKYAGNTMSNVCSEAGVLRYIEYNSVNKIRCLILLIVQRLNFAGRNAIAFDPPYHKNTSVFPCPAVWETKVFK